uniref:Hormone-sensitive lipase n=1 Tax=Ganoderma boninense TaxID=34458 RepID=A0A5K1K839_9APHY|nr:Hormone-sensitive lipase [Ganoderma boninense]
MSPKGSRGGAASGAKMTPSDAARIQSTQTKAGNDAGKGSFPARAQSAAAKNTAGSAPSSKASGKGPKA